MIQAQGLEPEEISDNLSWIVQEWLLCPKDTKRKLSLSELSLAMMTIS